MRNNETTSKYYEVNKDKILKRRSDEYMSNKSKKAKYYEENKEEKRSKAKVNYAEKLVPKVTNLITLKPI